MFPIESFRNTLLEIVEVLRQHEIPFHLTGGITGIAYGELRLTQVIDAVMEAVKKDSFLHGMDVKRTDKSISCEYDVEFLAKIIFRLRFREYWDVGPHGKHAEREYRQRIKLEWEFRRKAAKQARTQAAHRIGDPIYRRKSSVYWISDLGHFKDLDADEANRRDEDEFGDEEFDDDDT